MKVKTGDKVTIEFEVQSIGIQLARLQLTGVESSQHPGYLYVEPALLDKIVKEHTPKPVTVEAGQTWYIDSDRFCRILLADGKDVLYEWQIGKMKHLVSLQDFLFEGWMLV
jgi:hypothetical protein